MKRDKKSIIRIVTAAAKEYDILLKNRQFLIVYQEGREEKFTEVGFRDMHFLHLTGIGSRLSAQRFYEACINGKLAEDDIELDKTGKVEQKLQVLPYLSGLLYHKCMIGSFLNSGVMIRADYFVGDTRMVLSVGFRYGRGIDIPVSLYRGDVRKLTNPTHKVLAIFSRQFPENTYRKATFVAKGVDINGLKVSRGLIRLQDEPEQERDEEA